MRSKLFQWNKRDFWKGLIVAVLTALFTALYTVFGAGADMTVKAILWPTLAAFFAYMAKNLFTDSNGEILGNGNSNL